MNTTALIMAGGRGERFWPRSRKSLPKQFLSLTDDGKTMIQLTVERILPLVKMEDIYIATNKNYKDLVRSQLPGIPEENILCEPVGRNTAPCIGLGAAHIGKKYENALMLVLPSDHLIKFNNMFLSALREACRVAMEDDNLVTLGITPTYPETGYGYIKFNPQKTLGGAYQVERFVEKPTLEVAKEYLETEEYLWNSGMFIWKLSSIWKNMEKYMEDFVDLQLQVHSKTSPLLKGMKDKLSRQINSLKEVDATTRYELLTRLESMPKHNKVCHGDFNPSNVIVGKNGKMTVVDWAHATQGNASADAAMTYLLFALKDQETADLYMKIFCKKSDTAKQYVQQWLPIVAAAQLTKDNELEKDFLMKWIDVIDYQ